MDTLFAIVRRLLKHEPIMKPDKSHLHHQLLKLNFSVRTTVLIIYFVDILFAIASIIYVFNDPIYGIIIYIVLFVLVLLLIIKTDIIHNRNN
jgi:UDP-GlcNAc:undecaprenyl-phosphate GlcNAc-1-phosphate transferase